MEWYESLFLQACGHVLTQSRVANLRRISGALNLDTEPTRDLVAAYQRSVGLVFSVAEMQQKLASGAECVLLLLVHEHQFSSTLEQLQIKHDVVLSATLRTDARSSDFSNYHIDVALIRKTSSGAKGIAH
ncbi:MAG: hypothetical protein ACRESP_12285 [Pseudomonas sp.]